MRILIDKETGEEFEVVSALKSVLTVKPIKKPLKKIDLSNLDHRVPVRVTAKGETLMDLFTKSGGVVLGFDSPILTLKTDRWVFNCDGTNPWPEGCVVEARFSSEDIISVAERWMWDLHNGPRILASRYVGTAEGWAE